MLLHNSTDNLTEVLSEVGKTEAWAIQHKIAGQVREQTLVKGTGEGLKAHVHQQVPPFTLEIQLCLVAQGMPLVPCRCRETVILLLGICTPGVREKGPEPAGNKA